MKYIFLILTLCCFFVYPVVSADSVLLQVTVISDSGDTGGGGSGSGGGGGGGGGGGSSNTEPTITATTLSVSGIISPNAPYTILQNSTVIGSWTASADSTFTNTLSIKSGNTNFVLNAKDIKGRTHPSLSFVAQVPKSGTVLATGVFPAPSLFIDKSQVARGENITFSGKTAPSADVSIFVISATSTTLFETKANTLGDYQSVIGTAHFVFGEYRVETKAITKTNQSIQAGEYVFVVGATTILATEVTPTAKADMSGDGRVNLTDFSMMAYWYKRSAPPAVFDLNNDGVVTIADFSILAFYWTG